MKSSLSTKEIKETGIFKFFDLFLKIWRIGKRYKADNMGESMEPHPTPMSTLKEGDKKLF